ncbi:DNA-binding protein [Streptomyces avermitilis]|uniref:DNA-binding protein n=2 Tax=Streptomyces avermitilis TaxID=33903 RepID=Q82I95_STRAW|nr:MULTISPECIES: helix-turn-helix transcriptional regulator [Streptomyces]KUN57100.1 DNA-binding protein [Streptomyces avermitilis]MYS98863.1 helix-turn-helix domain-containing protein [Streptomyces sp. SID5469]OOV33687.1 transcriptional regulator [Streptomyces avermitilis]BAC70974.1 putative DNA-binding protein [Streptomyces avermitilis MA-4680 = NBRC 14893]
MPTRSTPTERQKRLGAELRKMRLAAGAPTEYAAGLLGIDRTRLSNMESGIRPFSPDRVRTLACNYSCTDDGYIEALVAMTSTKERGWWERHRGILPSGLLDIAELEWHATRVRTAQVMHAPGLLQTEDYARGVFTAVLPPLTRLEVELRVAHRMERQQVLERPSPLPYIAYVHEAVLRMPYGGTEATQQQLKHLCSQSERENIEVRVIPTSTGGFPGAGHALLYADGAVPQLDTVQLDSAHGPEFTHADAQLTKYRSHLNWMDGAAMTSAASRDLIRKIARDL